MPDFITSYPEKSRKKWIITGGAGLIGCHAAAWFHAAGHRVIIVDNLTKGKRTSLRSTVCEGKGKTDVTDIDRL